MTSRLPCRINTCVLSPEDLPHSALVSAKNLFMSRRHIRRRNVCFIYLFLSVCEETVKHSLCLISLIRSMVNWEVPNL